MQSDTQAAINTLIDTTQATAAVQIGNLQGLIRDKDLQINKLVEMSEQKDELNTGTSNLSTTLDGSVRGTNAAQHELVEARAKIKRMQNARPQNSRRMQKAGKRAESAGRLKRKDGKRLEETILQEMEE